MSFCVMYWNYNNKKIDGLEEIPARLALHHQVDMLVLADTTVFPKLVLNELRQSDASFELWEDPATTLKVYTRFPVSYLEPYGTDGRVVVWRLRQFGLDVLLAAIHFYDRMTYPPGEQMSYASICRRTIREAEVRAGHSRTVLFGDTNMNPYDSGMVDPVVGFGSIASRNLTSMQSISIKSPADLHDDYRRFYNPMCARLGINPSMGPLGSHTYPNGPPGTHYFSNAGHHHNLFWHHIDQVLIRPELFDAFHDNEFEIITTLPGSGGGPSEELIYFAQLHWHMREMRSPAHTFPSALDTTRAK